MGVCRIWASWEWPITRRRIFSLEWAITRRRILWFPKGTLKFEGLGFGRMTGAWCRWMSFLTGAYNEQAVSFLDSHPVVHLVPVQMVGPLGPVSARFPISRRGLSLFVRRSRWPVRLLRSALAGKTPMKMECTCSSQRSTHLGFPQGEQAHHAHHRCPYTVIAERKTTDGGCECCPLCTLLCLPRKVLGRLPEFRDTYSSLSELGK